MYIFQSYYFKNIFENWSKNLSLQLATVVTVLCLGILWSRRKLYWASWKLPGPFALPFLGSLHLAVGMNTTEDIFNLAIFLMRKYGNMCRIWLGPRLVIIVTSPEDLEVIYNNPVCFEKDLTVLKGMRSALGDGLITAPVTVWKPHRKLINPTFSPKILSTFVDTFVDNANILAENIKKHAGQEEFDIFPHIFKTTVSFICETAFGTNFSTLKDVEEVLTKYLDQTMEICFQRMAKPWLYPDIIFFNFKIGKRFQRNMNYLDKIAYKVINEKRNEIRERKLNEESKIEDDGFKKKHFIELLIEQNDNGKGFTDKELRDQVNTFISGDKAYAEIKEIFGDSDRRITIEDLSKMKYIERVLKETLRFFPPLPLLVRYLKKDVKFATMTAPAGSTILFSNFFTQRDPNYWPNPLKFDPDRFLPEEVSKRHPYCYVPFGGGPRNCIGYRYAMMSMKILLCTLLRQYQFKSNIDIETVRIKVEIIMKAVQGHPVNIELRKK